MTLSFLNFLLGIVRELCQGKAEVYDEREKSLMWLMGNSMSSALGMACVVGVPSLSKLRDEPTHAGTHRLECIVALRHNAAIRRTNSYELAEELYAAIHGATWKEPTCEMPDEALQPNVTAESLRHVADESGNVTHSIVVSVEVSL